jgi:hypothetical protein
MAGSEDELLPGTCIICFNNDSNQEIWTCPTCHTKCHVQCITLWARTNYERHPSSYSCPVCRQNFEISTLPGAEPGVSYISFGTDDTSSRMLRPFVFPEERPRINVRRPEPLVTHFIANMLRNIPMTFYDPPRVHIQYENRMPDSEQETVPRESSQDVTNDGTMGGPNPNNDSEYMHEHRYDGYHPRDRDRDRDRGQGQPYAEREAEAHAEAEAEAEARRRFFRTPPRHHNSPDTPPLPRRGFIVITGNANVHVNRLTIVNHPNR